MKANSMYRAEARQALSGKWAFGIGIFFVTPYTESAHAAFYEDLKEN